MKRLLILAAAASLTAPLQAQAPVHDASQHDPTKKVSGGGTLPVGWHARLDSDSARPDAVKFATMGTGFHVMTGPAAIFYKTGMKLSGAYEAHATFTLMEPSAQPEAYGLFIGGSSLEGANQKYSYFLIRQDGMFLIKKREGAQTPTVKDWTAHAAIKKADASGKMTNALSVEVSKDKVRFLINGAEVASQSSAQIDTNGVAGLRINHNLNVHIEGFGVKSSATH